MRKAALCIIACIISVLSFGQTSEDPTYGFGKVPVKDGMVVFSDEITFNSEKISQEDVYGTLLQWAKGKFVKPIVISAKVKDSAPGRISANIEDYITFKKTAIITDRSRINYDLSINVSSSVCSVTISNISYWYEEERDGGSRFTAEEWITDREAFNRQGTKMLKAAGKFRIKTIDLVNDLEKEIKDVISTLETEASK